MLSNELKSHSESFLVSSFKDRKKLLNFLRISKVFKNNSVFKRLKIRGFKNLCPFCYGQTIRKESTFDEIRSRIFLLVILVLSATRTQVVPSDKQRQHFPRTKEIILRIGNHLLDETFCLLH